MTVKQMLLDNRYLLLKKIGGGGTSVVFLAEDMRLHKKWAVKKIDKNRASQLGFDPMHITALEADHLKKLQHPLFPQIVDLIYRGEAIFLVMEYIEGQPLNVCYRKNPGMCRKQKLFWMKSLAAGIAYLHKQSPPILYLDLKPSNILVCRDKTVRLIDFGIARPKNSQTSYVYGTKGYAAPEQAGVGGGKIDERTDIYGLGAVLYYLMYGEPPEGSFCRKQAHLNISNLVEHYPLNHILKKCLNQNPNRRLKNSDALWKALDRVEKRTQKKMMLSGFLMVIFMLLFVAARHDRKQEKDYMKMLRQADAAKEEKDYQKAATVYKAAMECVDKKRKDAYLGILQSYCELGKVQKGIEQVEEYLEYYDVKEAEVIYFQIGWLYFQELNDYAKSYQWLSKITGNQFPETVYYLKLAAVLEQEIDEKHLEKEIEEFLAYLNGVSKENSPTKEARLKGYYTILSLVIMYGEESDVNFRNAITAGQLGCKLGDSEWTVKFRRQLMYLYEKEEDYEKAVLEGVKILEEPLSEYNWSQQIESYLHIAEIYKGMGAEEQAVDYLERGIDKFPEEAELYFQYLLLGATSKQKIVAQDKIIILYEKCLEFPELKEDIRFEKLQLRIEFMLKEQEE